MPELKQGGKRVKWKEIIRNNGWYINESFLLKGRTFGNPTRLPEKDLRAYWQHWYDLAKLGQHFTFERTGSCPIEDESSGRVEEEIAGSGGQQSDKASTPKHCKSDEDRISFLHSLLPQFEPNFHDVINAVALVEVCCHLLITSLVRTF